CCSAGPRAAQQSAQHVPDTVPVRGMSAADPSRAVRRAPTPGAAAGAGGGDGAAAAEDEAESESHSAGCRMMAARFTSPGPKAGVFSCADTHPRRDRAQRTTLTRRLVEKFSKKSLQLTYQFAVRHGHDGRVETEFGCWQFGNEQRAENLLAIPGMKR